MRRSQPCEIMDVVVAARHRYVRLVDVLEIVHHQVAVIHVGVDVVGRPELPVSVYIGKAGRVSGVEARQVVQGSILVAVHPFRHAVDDADPAFDVCLDPGGRVIPAAPCPDQQRTARSQRAVLCLVGDIVQQCDAFDLRGLQHQVPEGDGNVVYDADDVGQVAVGDGEVP